MLRILECFLHARTATEANSLKVTNMKKY